MLHIKPIPAFNDNYIWLITATDSMQAVVVDPGSAEPVLITLKQSNLHLAAILITHHHSDHVGGIKQLQAYYPEVPVYGPANEIIPGITQRLEEGDTVHLSAIDATFTVIAVPGHTAGHIAYYGQGALFCGDTLFSIGCGRLFEGTPQQMHESLSKLAALPDATQIYCAHEYTLNNIHFAKQVEPNNLALQAREEAVKALRAKNKPTLPSDIGLEKATNPFLRVTEPAVIAAAETVAGTSLSAPATVFKTIRAWKDKA